MSKTRKIMSMVLVLAMLLTFMLTGCGTAEKGTAGTTSAATTASADSTTAAETEKGLEPVELNWYYIDGAVQDIDLVCTEISKYLKDKINASVKITKVDWGDFTTKFPLLMASGTPIDLTFTSSWANDFRPNVVKKAFLELNDLLDKYGPEIKKVLPQAFLDAATIDGKLYALSTNKEIGNQWAYLLNADLVKKYSFDLSTIKTYKDIEPMLKVIKDSEPGTFPLSISSGSGGAGGPFSSLPFDRILTDVPGSVMIGGDTKKIINEIESPEMKDYFITMYNWFTAGYIRKDAATVKNANEDANTGKWFANMISYSPYAELQRTRAWKVNCTYAPIQPVYATTAGVNGAMTAIPRSSKNPERAMMFLNLLYSDAVLSNMVTWGIEGTHYIKIDETHIDYPNGIDASNSKYASSAWEYGNNFLNLLWRNEPSDKWQKFEEFNKSAINAPSLGFAFDPTSVMTEITAVKNAWSQFIPAMSVGAVDPAKYLPQAIEKLKAAGIDKVIQEMQKQYDAWLATK